MKRRMLETEHLYLWEEIIYEILSWLPVKSVLRFRNVCKQWCLIVGNNDFVYKHMARAKGRWVYKDKTRSPSSYPEEWTILSYFFGLRWEIHSLTRNLRIRNPSTRKVIDLPRPSGNIIAGVRPWQDPSTREFKLVHLCPSPNIDNNDTLCCKVLTVGTDDQWRSVAFPFHCTISDIRIECKIICNAYLIICLPQSSSGAQEQDIKIACLGMQDENFFVVDIPRNAFRDWTHVSAMEWEGKLSLGCVQSEKLHVWVLENWREQIWVERKIAIENMGWDHAVPRGSKNKQLVIMNLNSEMLFRIDAVSGKCLVKLTAPEGSKFFSFEVPTLVHVKGMRTESQTMDEFNP